VAVAAVVAEEWVADVQVVAVAAASAAAAAAD
jgi:hypothetical protein